MKAAVFGAGGRIGLPLSLWLAKKYHKVYGYDLNQDLCNKLNTGQYVPFMENNLQEYLARYVAKENIVEFSTNDFAKLNEVDIIFVVVGSALKPDFTLDLSNVYSVIHTIKNNCTNLKNKFLIIRSTVEVGTTDKIWDLFDDNNRPKIYYSPERVLEGNAIEEFENLPVLIGIPEKSPEKSLKNEGILVRYISANLIVMSAKEAEFSKLVTNMTRYAGFALSNHFMMLADTYNIDYNQLFPKFKQNYDRLNDLKAPGPNVGGPCLYKDGFAFDSNLLRSMWNINSVDVLEFLINKVNDKFVIMSKMINVLILGKAFKPESDDARNSMTQFVAGSFPQHYKVTVLDPYIDDMSILTPEFIKKFDAFVVMTPHNSFIENGTYELILRHMEQHAWFFNYWLAFMREHQSYNNPLLKYGSEFQVTRVKKMPEGPLTAIYAPSVAPLNTGPLIGTNPTTEW